MSEPTKKWTAAELESDDVSKKDLVDFLQTNSSSKFLKDNKLFGQSKSIAKSSKKPHLIDCYEKLFIVKAFKNEEEERQFLAEAERLKKIEEEEKLKKAENSANKVTPKKVSEKNKFVKTIIKKGNINKIPKEGNTCMVRYKGMLPDGTVFDQNMEKENGRRMAPELKIVVGSKKSIIGFERALLTMGLSEKAKFVIEPEWAYGEKGLSVAGIPPNTPLTFEIELTRIM
eukprot:GCRY01004408.1.p1 GENE.GCRY01004408.1~~GCRY01004408.1.p1  ORF type:complete len:229 (+),score=63.31 GCRY01004408.1:147-833(+)